MSSTLLPNGQETILPIVPTDGQIFLDSDGVKWTYNKKTDMWEKSGVIGSFPLANSTTQGLLSAQDKSALDRIPAVPGGFGIITDTKLLLRSPTNPDGVIQGNIKLKSESLDITCVGVNKAALNCASPPLLDCIAPVSGSTPGLSFKLSDRFLDTLIVDIYGPRGKDGDKGDKGLDGIPGYSDGPKGITGIKGTSVTEVCELTGIEFNDLPGITDNAIVDLKMATDDGHGCRVIITKSKLNINGTIADKVTAIPLSRTVTFSSTGADCSINRLGRWTLNKPPGDATPLSLQLIRIPKGNVNTSDPVNFNGTLSLVDFVSGIVAEYIDRLRKLDTQWGDEVKKYVNGIDDNARTILSDLANQLSMCEFNLPAYEYCLTLVPCSVTQRVPIPSPF